MPRTCSVCTHRERHAIETALVERESYRDIAGRFSVSKSALSRHAKEHLPELLAKAHEAEEAGSAGDLLEEVRALKDRAEKILDRTEVYKPTVALRAIAEIRAHLELLARLAGELKEAPTVNLYLSPEWLELRGVIIAALAPHPDARESVLRALEGG